MLPAAAAPDPDAVPDLWQHFGSLLREGTEPAPWAGPRWWWAGPLDVEGLALGSMQAAATAVAALSQRRVTFDSQGVAAWFDSYSHLRIAGSPIQAFGALSGFRRAADGWVRIHGNYPHHARALLDAVGATSADDVVAALREMPALAIEELVTATGGLAVAVRTPNEWAGSEAGRAVADQPWVRFTLEDSPSVRRSVSQVEVPLEGVRVLDLTRVIAGPSASRLLGALGADVLRIDPPALPELEHQHVETGFAKRSAEADLRNPEVFARVRELLADADVILSGYRGAALARYGLDAGSLRANYPGLAVVTLDAWGDRGPWAERRGFDSIVQAATGIAHIYGTGSGPDFKPGALPVQALDYATGLGVAAAAVVLVLGRKQGISGAAHLSLARTAHELLGMRGRPDLPAVKLESRLLRTDSAYGELVYAPPPLVIDDRAVDYPEPPQKYGSAELAWR
ncbi:hypothetical protein GC088_00345 [Arthrobacter sp. JZ12]|uniref:CoA transferase n=1 Tax=Arthrobacter sp. JZ12 TaxID=2654190 RepID=UPI002B471C92|nr:CoA transferase [Arthrobacter sp. JZ12]WRH23726.1 hypothetical protein GC088_00345 [Arthrobacter sp. JZ12]